MSLLFTLEIYLNSLVGTAGYLLIVLCILWFSRTRQSLILVGAASSFFIIAAYFILISAVDNHPAITVNRVLSIVVIWVAIDFAYRFNRLYDEQRSKSNQLNSLFNNANEGILFTDKGGKIILANPYLEKMFGYEAGQLVGENISVLMPEKYFSNHIIHLRKYVGKPVSRPMGRDLWAKHKSGKEFPVEISLSHFYDRDELNIIAFILDTTEKKKHQQIIEANFNRIKSYNLELEEKVRLRTHELEQANQALKKSQQLYQAMAHYFPDGIIGVLNKDMEYLLVDGQDLRPKRSGGDAIIGEALLDDIRSAIVNYGSGALEQVFKGEGLSFDVEVKNRIYNIVSVPIPGDPIHEVLIVAKNITDQKKVENHLLKNLEREKELSLLKSRFVTTASHEFRTPLTTILSSAFLLEHYTGAQLEEEKGKHLGRIKRSVQGLTDLLNDFLSLGKLEEGKVKVEYDEINLYRFLEELLNEVDPLRKENQKFRFVFEGNERYVVTDKHLLRNILMNLISNAIKYSPVSADIDIIATVNDDRMEISVTDYGMGIPEDEHKHVFKRFFRAQNVNEIQGTGLGLNIVKKYVALLKGAIEFNSKLNEGTTFTVSLPLATNVTNLTRNGVVQ